MTFSWCGFFVKSVLFETAHLSGNRSFLIDSIIEDKFHLCTDKNILNYWIAHAEKIPAFETKLMNKQNIN